MVYIVETRRFFRKSPDFLKTSTSKLLQNRQEQFATCRLHHSHRIMVKQTQKQNLWRSKGDTCPIAEQVIDNEDCVRPYEGEPVADEEWIAQYKAKRNSAEERLQIHRNRLEGFETLGNWYV